MYVHVDRSEYVEEDKSVFGFGVQIYPPTHTNKRARIPNSYLSVLIPMHPSYEVQIY